MGVLHLLIDFKTISIFSYGLQTIYYHILYFGLFLTKIYYFIGFLSYFHSFLNGFYLFYFGIRNFVNPTQFGIRNGFWDIWTIVFCIWKASEIGEACEELLKVFVWHSAKVPFKDFVRCFAHLLKTTKDRSSMKLDPKT